MTLSQFLLILWARRRLALLVLLGTFLLTLVVSLLLPKEYTASTSIVVDVKSPDPIMGTILPGLISPSYMATQIDVIESDRVARRVVKLLGLDKNPAAIAAWKEAGDDVGTIETFYAEALGKKLDVKPSRESNVIAIHFSGADPAFAAAVANAYAQAYLETTVELRVEPARQYATWFDERVKVLRGNLEKAQARLSSYQREKGIVASDERLDHETQRLNELTAQLVGLQGQSAEAASRQKNTGHETSFDVLQNPLIQNIKAEIARQEAKLKEVGSSLGKNHPQMKQLESQLAALKQQLQEEIQRISGGAASASRSSNEREAAVRAAIDAQKQRILELKAQRDEIQVMVKEVENAQRAFEGAGQRMSATTLESQSQQTNVLILSPAVEPPRPSKPRVLLNLILSVFMGGMLGVGAALLREFLDRRVRDAEDLVALAGVPVLGVLRAEPPRSRLRSIFGGSRLARSGGRA